MLFAKSVYGCIFSAYIELLLSVSFTLKYASPPTFKSLLSPIPPAVLIAPSVGFVLFNMLVDINLLPLMFPLTSNTSSGEVLSKPCLPSDVITNAVVFAPALFTLKLIGPSVALFLIITPLPVTLAVKMPFSPIVKPVFVWMRTSLSNLFAVSSLATFSYTKLAVPAVFTSASAFSLVP